MQDDDANPVRSGARIPTDNFKLNFKDVAPFWSEVNKGTKVDYRHCNLN